MVGLFFNSLTAVANETPHISNSSATKKAQQRCIYNYCMYFIYIMLWFIYAKEFIPIKKERKKVEQKMLLCRVGYWTHTWRGGKTSFKAFIPSPSVLFNNEFCQRVIHRVAGYLVPICLILAGYPVQVCLISIGLFCLIRWHISVTTLVICSLLNCQMQGGQRLIIHFLPILHPPPLPIL